MSSIKDLAGKGVGLDKMSREIAKDLKQGGDRLEEYWWQQVMEKAGNDYRPSKNGLPLGSRVFKFCRDGAELKDLGQGTISINNELLWGMPEEVFKRIFGIESEEKP